MTVASMLNMSNADIQGLNRKVDVIFSDGVLEMVPSEMLIDKIILGSLLRNKNTPIDMEIKKRYSIVDNYTNGLFSPDCLNNTLSNIRTDVGVDLFMNLPKNTVKVMENLDKSIIDVINDIYVYISTLAYRDIVTLDITTMFEIYEDEDIRDAVANVKKRYDPESIKSVYDTIDKVIYDKYSDNALGLAYLTKVAKPKQVQHIVGSRGFVQDLDSKIYKYPVPYGYLEGLKDIVSYLIESKTAAIAIFHSTKSIQDSEWFAREAQIKTQAVRKLVYTDCKTRTNLLKIKVTSVGLKDFIGCLYLEDLDDGVYKLAMDDSVVGKTLYFRHAGSCNLETHDEVCVKCFGLMGIGLTPTTNLGTYCSVSITESKTQGLLGFKHLLDSAKPTTPKLREAVKPFLQYIDKDKSIKVRSQSIKIKGNNTLHIEIPMRNVPALKEGGGALERLDTTYTKQLSEFKELLFLYVDKDGVETDEVGSNILYEDNTLSFSTEFIRFVLENECYSVGSNDNLRINLEGWREFSSVPFIIPGMAAAGVTGALDIFKKLITSCKLGTEEPKPIEINSALSRLYSNIGHGDHLSLISVFMYATTIDSNNPFKLGRADDNRICHKYRDSFKYASFSAILGYGYITQIMSYGKVLSPLREDHLLDVLVTPEILN